MRTLIPFLSCLALATPLPAGEIGLTLALQLTSTLPGLVNPLLQPSDLFDRHLAVAVVEVTALDAEHGTATLAVRQVLKGTVTATTITLTQAAAAPAVNVSFQRLLETGLNFVAYIGQKGRSRETKILLYLGGDGQWQGGTITTVGTATTPATWCWEEVFEKEMYGTFNGHPAQLVSMMRDKAAERCFFPALPISRFGGEQVLGQATSALGGVALYDLDRDGRLDAVATSKAGCQIHLQRSPGKFSDTTATSGLAGVHGRSIGIADSDGDGMADLLIDGQLYHQDTNGRFSRDPRLPESADQLVIMATFADLDNDGYPDVVVAQQGGWKAFRHPGAVGGAYIDATHALGLDRNPPAGEPGGFFTHGDLRGDGRTAIFCGTGNGLLLERATTGQFEPTSMPSYDLSGPTTGGGCFGALWQIDTPTVAFATARNVNLVQSTPLDVSDVGRYGNETVVVTEGAQAVIAEDLSASGNIDLFAISSDQHSSNTLYSNRGYGSFMVPTRYQADAIAAKAYLQGAGGVAAGDTDGDGANDLLLGGLDGRLVLLHNDARNGRGDSENPTQTEQALANIGYLNVQVSGALGVVGATVTVTNASGRILAWRQIGGNTATGCRGPDGSAIAVRESGPMTVRVRYSDGAVASMPATVISGSVTAVVCKHPGTKRTP